METDALKNEILDLYNRGENRQLADLLISKLSLFREKTLVVLEDLTTSGDAKLRLKLLEILMKDGGADLIPFYIETIRVEENTLYAKSLLLLVREFQHQEALTALLSLEVDISPELKGTYQRALGKLLAQFSEQFYMSEFRSGQGDRRRVRAAVNMMLRSPHPDYVPFLNQQILVNDMGFRSEGLRALQELGDGDSLQAMFTLLGKLIVQTGKAAKLQQALKSQDAGAETAYLALCQESGEKDHGVIDERLDQIQNGRVLNALNPVLDAFELTGEIRFKLENHLIDLLKGTTPSGFDTSRALTMARDHSNNLLKLSLDLAQIMGELGKRFELADFIDRLEGFLPYSAPNRDQIFISGLGGFRNDDAFALLVEYVNTCDEPDLLAAVLDALALFESRDIPNGVQKLCINEKDGVLRCKALNLLAVWHKSTETLIELMTHPSLAVRADAVTIAARHQNEACYPHILKMLGPNVPDSLTIAIIEALAAFDTTQTGKAVKPFLQQPNSGSVRRAALNTIFKAGGPERFDLIFRAFDQDTSDKLSENVDTFLKLMLGGDLEQLQPLILKHRELWLGMIAKTTDDVAVSLIAVLERLEDVEVFQAKAWIHGLQRTHAQLTGTSRDRLAKVLGRFEEQVRDWTDREQRAKQLQTLLQATRTPNQFEKVQAMRKLANSFNSDLVDNNPAGLKTLIRIIEEQLAKERPGLDMLLQVITLSAKLRHPKLHKKLERFREYPNISVRNAVKKALNAPVDQRFIKPIESVFVMDDSRYIVKQLTKVLDQSGFQAESDTDVHVGLQMLGRKTFDLLILDFYMPGLNGIEFLAEARKQGTAPEHTLVVTSSRDKDELAGFVEAGIDGLLLKPFRMEEMITRIKELEPKLRET